VILTVILFVAKASFAESLFHSKEQRTYFNNIIEIAEHKENNKTENILYVKVLPAPGSDADTARQEKKEQEKSRIDNLIAYSTLGLGIITGILAIFTGALWLATRKLVIDTKDTSKRQLRAYVNVLQGKVFNPYDPPNRIFRIDIKNFGQTPAHDVSIVYQCIIREFPLDKTKPLNEITNLEHGFYSVLAPSCIYRQDILAPVNAEWVETKLADGTAAIYCFGEVKYRDAFNDNHITTFRYMCRGEGIANGDVSPCEDGSKAT